MRMNNYGEELSGVAVDMTTQLRCLQSTGIVNVMDGRRQEFKRS